MSKTAIILGATGLTGGILLNKLLKDDRYEHIKVFGRNSTGKCHEKIEEFICDLFNTVSFKDKFEGDEVYCCIGTTASKTPHKKYYKKIDFGIPVSIAKLCKEKEINTLVVISSMGANANSPIFYNRIKGEMENEVLRQDIKKTFLIQPALIRGKRKEKRPMEFIFKKLFLFLNLILVGPLKKYRSIEPETIANAMIKLANTSEAYGRITSEYLVKTGKNEP